MTEDSSSLNSAIWVVGWCDLITERGGVVGITLALRAKHNW